MFSNLNFKTIMFKSFKFSLFALVLILWSANSFANRYVDIIVAADGTGNATTINEAIQSLQFYNYERVVIFIKNGIYNEKFRVDQDNVTFLGESKDSTIIQYAQLRSDWEKNRDYTGPGVVNVFANDVIFENLTIENSQTISSGHAFAIYGTGTRTIILNCNVKSNGGDTVSLWNYQQGQYYHANCYFQGAIDFVCPRGSCYITDSQFYELKPHTASIWMAATFDPNMKMVIRNSSFDGVKDFELGRHHYEAAFYLIDCKFSQNMADTAIYKVTYKNNPSAERPYFWGERKYFHNCIGDSLNYKWHADNLFNEKGKYDGSIYTAAWTFNNQWNPEATEAPKVTEKKIVDNKTLDIFFSELMTIRGELVLKTSTGVTLTYQMGRGRDQLRFSADKELETKDLKLPLEIISGEMLATKASVKERIIGSKF